MTLNKQGQDIADAIADGLALGADDWYDPAFGEARFLLADVQWDFSGWEDAYICLTMRGRLGGANFAEEEE